MRALDAGAKAQISFCTLTARLKSCPVTKQVPSWKKLGNFAVFEAHLRNSILLILVLLTMQTVVTHAQQSTISPLAIVPIDGKNPPQVTGSLEVTAGRAIIANNGTVTAGDSTAELILPHRGTLRVCASTTVKLSADSSVPTGEVPGLMIAIDRGALETSFGTGRNSDVVLTPDFRILIGGPGAAEVKIRLGEHGDTCVDNPGANGPYVVVTSVFEGGVYRVQPGQRVMFEHGSLSEVVDDEKEPCGCPPTVKLGTNDFPMAQSAGLAQLTPPTTTVGTGDLGRFTTAPSTTTLVHNAPNSTDAKPTDATPKQAAPEQKKPEKKSGFFSRVGHFFSKLFGAE
jgi:hypothetical protein